MNKKQATVLTYDYAQASAAIARCLATLGWTQVNGAALARKFYDTAVGKKEAHAYLAKYGPAETVFSLTGDYTSEGRNILEAHSVQILKEDSLDSLHERVKKFATQVDKVVGESYAARLLRPQDDSAVILPNTNQWRHTQTVDEYVDFERELIDFADDGNTSIEMLMSFNTESRTACMRVVRRNNDGDTRDLGDTISISWEEGQRQLAEYPELLLLVKTDVQQDASTEDQKTVAPVENRHTMILQHSVNWSLRGEGAPNELDDCSVDHIQRLIGEGYNQGELCLVAEDGETEYRGWWWLVIAGEFEIRTSTRP